MKQGVGEYASQVYYIHGPLYKSEMRREGEGHEEGEYAGQVYFDFGGYSYEYKVRQYRQDLNLIETDSQLLSTIFFCYRAFKT